jgi:hypothetical protein
MDCARSSNRKPDAKDAHNHATPTFNAAPTNNKTAVMIRKRLTATWYAVV